MGQSPSCPCFSVLNPWPLKVTTLWCRKNGPVSTPEGVLRCPRTADILI